MGWTTYRAQRYKKGSIDRKAECDSLFSDWYKVRKSAMVGSVYYSAIEVCKRSGKPDENGNLTIEDIPENERRTYGIVILTSVNMNSFFNFSYKDMSEDMGPGYSDCPASILKLLSPTDNEWANEWRKACWETIEKKKRPDALKNLPVGSVIRFTYGDETVELVKCSAAHQFKRPFWYNADNNTYMPATRIPDKYEVVTA